jgi:hypothetical protein
MLTQRKDYRASDRNGTHPDHANVMEPLFLPV